MKASLARRTGAFLIDHLFITCVAMIPFFVSFNSIAGKPDSFFTLFPIIMTITLVGLLFKDVFGGRSIGKRLTGIKVAVYDDAKKTPPVSMLILRNIMMLLWCVEFFVIIKDEQGRRLGDRIAKTQVVCCQNLSVTRKALIGITVFVVFFVSLFCGLMHVIKNDASYETAIQHIENAEEITAVAGEIEGFGAFPTGSIDYTNGYGNANLGITVYGSKQNLVINIHLKKSPEANWVVINMRY